MPQPSAQSCSNCAHYFQAGSGQPGYQDECHLLPPVRAGWAASITLPVLWCGQWRAASGPSAAEQRTEELAGHLGQRAAELDAAIRAQRK